MRCTWKIDKEGSQCGIKRQLSSYLGSFALNSATGYSVNLITEVKTVGNLRDHVINFVLGRNSLATIV